MFNTNKLKERNSNLEGTERFREKKTLTHKTHDQRSIQFLLEPNF